MEEDSQVVMVQYIGLEVDLTFDFAVGSTRSKALLELLRDCAVDHVDVTQM